MNRLQKAIFKTLAYADVFDYPLKAKEIWRFLISSEKFDIKEVQQQLSQPQSFFQQQGVYYFLSGRRQIINARKKREAWSRKKLKKAVKIARWLKLIPWIKMVGVTGALAMKNSDQEDDLDFLIITAHDRLWLTRLLSVVLIELVAARRRPGDQKVRDKICLNMFLDEVHLKIPQKEQDLFTAHEICQLRQLWDKNGIYQKFIVQNQWFKKYLANWKN